MKSTLRISPAQAADLRWLLAGRSAATFGSAAAFLALTLQVAAAGQPLLLTALYLSNAVPAIAMAPLAGRLVDRVDSRRLLLVLGVVQVLLAATLAVLPHTPGEGILGGLLPLLVAQMVLQASLAVTLPCWAALVPHVVGEQAVARVSGHQLSLSALAGAAGAGVAALLLEQLGFAATVLVQAGAFALETLAAARVRTVRRPQPAAPRGERARGGWQVVRADRVLLTVLLSSVAVVLAVEATNVLRPVLVTVDLGAPAWLYALGTSAAFAGQVVGAQLAGRIGSERTRVLSCATGTLAMGSGLLLTGLLADAWAAAALGLLVAAGSGAYNTSVGALLVLRAPDASRGRVLATLTGCTRTASVLALTLGGLAAGWWGAAGSYVALGGLAVAVGAVMVVVLRRALRDEPAAAALVPAVP
ncbi:MFS transporter [Auraticoccus sp. F435]|uniref:MFS transporter n=1 Tax=Auraticoccus cholistanensis TaxID=2656650 RepID=A0A6A9V1S1_9ACTN|nr:MFS transporter [Auraticoccus cholistanensis]MVA77527.1 MFS transporter [Auraticoccus cholistanensis]